MSEKHNLEKRDYTLIIDKSGSMSDPDNGLEGSKSRWDVMQESTLALARKCEKYDPDGITIYIFSNKFKRFENVTASKVKQIFKENEPSGRTNLASVLQDALQNYFQRKAKGQAKANGETILVVTDGEADEQFEVIKVIVEATKQIDRPEELAISFIQIGNDQSATRFLKFLDDSLEEKAEAKYDIVDTVTIEDIEEGNLTFEQVLLNAIID
ncbi:VWA domain-containing protein [Nostoc favosum]|uniref:VWA domain-containing protein n=1 Tax=Nostoc favosum CHAB5714 TaxID=2780399 RepID=A0ABS8I615_9NOSO|nr:VWA domain-containing protein [Nostoc favosum]MCC5599436.1 VWA domain-containing protein [Nostoc favosum CHAB5714]